MSKTKEYKNLKEFWPFYLSQHQNETNRMLHFIGSAGGLFWLSKAIRKKNPLYLLAGLVNGYGCAWIGHFIYEKNKPATFEYPAESFISDWLLFYTILTNKIEEEMEQAGLS